MSWVAGLALMQSFVISSPEQAASTAAARPDTVLVAAAGDFAARLAWAEQTARSNRYTSYWVGWAIGGDPGGSRWFYVDRNRRDDDRVRGYGGWSVSGSAGGLSFAGIDLPALTGSRDAHDIAVLVRYETAGGRTTPVRVHAGSYAFPLIFDGGALLWLGGATDAENVSRARDAFSAATDDDVRAGLVAAVGASRESAVAAPVLRAWLDDLRLSSPVRREAANWLGYHPDREGTASLTRVARSDTSLTVRGAALRSIARSAPPATSVDVLVGIGRDDSNPRVRRDAVQALGTVDDERAFRALVDLVERPADTAQTVVRAEAMQVLARQARQGQQVPQATIDLFARVARSDPDTSVELRAVDALIAVRDERATTVLINLVESHPNGRVQMRSVQGLARAQPSADVLRALQRIVNGHPRPETQRAAVRSMATVNDPAVRDILADMAEKHPSAEIRKAALDALVQLHRMRS
jgi:HEAT repeat protein